MNNRVFSLLSLSSRPTHRPLLRVMLLSLGLFGCENEPYQLSNQYQSANYDSRIEFLIFHYTDENEENSLKVLTDPQYKVSSHYLIPRESQIEPLPIYQLVPDNERAWHAGRSRWLGQSALNNTSLGIEIVNEGYPDEDGALPAPQRRWQPYQAKQIVALAALSKGLIERYHIPPQQVLAHSDIAPLRKQDPGPHFPWRALYMDYGIGAWPDENRVWALLNAAIKNWDALTWQQQLARYGYDIALTGTWDEQSRAVMRAFQLHFRQAKIDGLADPECQAILMSLLEKYFP